MAATSSAQTRRGAAKSAPTQQDFETCCMWLYGWKQHSHALNDETRQMIREWWTVPPMKNAPLKTRPEWLKREQDVLLSSERLNAESFGSIFPKKSFRTSPDGDVLLGSHRLLELLTPESDRMGLVFKAVVDGAGDPIHRAIKLANPLYSNLKPPERQLRFVNECRLQKNVKDDNVVRTFDYHPDPLPHIAMEFLYGPTLQMLLDHFGGEPIPIAWAKDLIVQIAKGLYAGHEHPLRIVHRDVKPANILLIKTDNLASYPFGWRVCLCDYGLAWSQYEGRMTRASSLREGAGNGTQGHMAPEQTNPKLSMTTACDIYQLGILAYELLSGCNPRWQIVGHQQVLKYDFNLPSPLEVDGLSESAAKMVLRMLAEMPGERPAIDEVIAAFDPKAARQSPRFHLKNKPKSQKDTQVPAAKKSKNPRTGDCESLDRLRKASIGLIVHDPEAVDLLEKHCFGASRALSRKLNLSERSECLIKELVSVDSGRAVDILVAAYLETSKYDLQASLSRLARIVEHLCYHLLPVIFRPVDIENLVKNVLKGSSLFELPVMYKGSVEFIMAGVDSRPTRFHTATHTSQPPVGRYLIKDPPEGGVDAKGTSFVASFRRALAKEFFLDYDALSEEQVTGFVNVKLGNYLSQDKHRLYYAYLISPDAGEANQQQKSIETLRKQFPLIVFFGLDVRKALKDEVNMFDLFLRILCKVAGLSWGV